jgi:hypothetical protein
LRRLEGEGATLSSILFGAGVAAGSVSLLRGLFTQVLADDAILAPLLVVAGSPFALSASAQYAAWAL